MPSERNEVQRRGDTAVQTATDSSLVPEGAAGETPERQYRGGNRRMWLLLITVLVAGLGYGYYWWGWVRGTITTDDAYVTAPVVSIASRVRGRIAEVLLEEGAKTAPGDLMARIQADKFEIQVSQMNATVSSAAAKLKELLSYPRPEEVAVARAQVRVAEIKLQTERRKLKRALRLARVRAISAQELDNAESGVEIARSELDVTRQRLKLLRAGPTQGGIDQAKAAVALANARLESAQSNLADTRIIATFNGVVARRLVEPGEYVNEGQALFQVVQTGRSWVVANLEEGDISEIREGQPAQVWIDAYAGHTIKARVGPLFPATLSQFSLLPSSSASGSFVKVTQRVPVRIDWAQDDLPPMYPGLNAVVRIVINGEVTNLD